MEKKIVKDILFLSQVSQPASQEDLYLARDLQDTLLANRETCVGIAANMIGVQKHWVKHDHRNQAKIKNNHALLHPNHIGSQTNTGLTIC